MKFLRILLQVLICAFIFQFPFAWILRDGLGPDSLETFGFVAASKAFMTFYSGPILAPELLIGSVAYQLWDQGDHAPCICIIVQEGLRPQRQIV